MLTQNEKQWLRERIKFPIFSCFHCAKGRSMLEKHNVCYNVYPCVAENLVSTKDDVLEAAEFSERVALKLALGCESQTPCNGCWRAQWKQCNLRKGYWDCADCFLKVARLGVEEEMDNEKHLHRSGEEVKDARDIQS